MKKECKNKLNSRTRAISSLPLLAICLPAMIFTVIFHYIPLFGVVIAFKDYNYIDGILGSPWVGIENFKFFFSSNDAVRVIFNTVGYNILFMLLEMLFGVILALMMYEINSRGMLKYVQTTTSIPYTLSIVVIAYIVYALLSYDSGLINSVIRSFGGKGILWYNTPKYWPFILTFTHLWQMLGFGCLLYYAALIAVDQQLFEAASIDGASRMKQIIHISIPELVPIICLKIIMGVGNVVNSSLGLFYQIPMNSSALYSTTDVISTYVLRGLQTGSIGVTAAVGLAQNVCGFILLIVSNSIIKKIRPENALF